MKIIITEKPSVAQEYKKVLKVNQTEKTDGYIQGKSEILGDVIITWAVGHLIQIAEPKNQNPNWEKWNKDNLPMLPCVWKYEPQTATKKQFNVVKSVYTRKDIDCIYYAGDSGREGIYIQALIRNQIFKKNPTFDEKVVWIDSYTEESILDGIKNAKPYSEYQNMIDSGYMRAISDWLIGMNFTQAFTLTSGGFGNVINVGRVMTPTLAMIVKRQEEIENFKKVFYYGIKADNFASWKAVKGSRYFEGMDLYNENGFIKKEKAQELINELNTDRKLTVEDVKVQTKTEYAPYLFNLADLQAFCSKNFKISPKQTLEVAQTLYEKKLTTYPRTDARFLSTAVANDLKKKGYDVPKRYIDDSKITDHYAIIPTFYSANVSMSDLEKSVYNAILKRFTDTMLPPYIYDSIVVTFKHKNGEYFFDKFQIVKQSGWKNVEQKNPEYNYIPKKNEIISVNEFVISEMETKPPTQYTTGTLILAMEKAGKLIDDEELREQIKTCGIGTSATRAGIIDKLANAKFIEIEKKSQKISATDIGKNIISIVEKFDETLTSPIKTADMENKLNAIVNGEITKNNYMDIINEYVKNLTLKIIRNNKDKIRIDDTKKTIQNKSSSAWGKTAQNNTEKQSSNTNNSNYSSWGKKNTEASSNNNNSWGKKSTEKSDNKSENKTEKQSNSYNCPCCSNELKFGKYGWFCQCGFSLGLEICNHKMNENDLKDIIEKGHTKSYTFVSKAGKAFLAELHLNKDTRKLDFKFKK